jgi:hypothetical protein
MMWIDNRARIKKPDQTGSNETLESGFSSKELPEYVTINPRLAKHFWIPDVFIDQAKQIREPTFHVLPASLRVYRFKIIYFYHEDNSHNLLPPPPLLSGILLALFFKNFASVHKSHG